MFVTDGRAIICCHQRRTTSASVRVTPAPTRGMGAISPVPFLSEEFQQKALNQVIIPTIKGLEKDGILHSVIFGLIKGKRSVRD